MGQLFINGAQYAFATTQAAAIPITGISNAMPAVAESATLPNAGDIILLSSNWSSLIGQAVRVAANPAPAAGSFTLDGLDTTDEQYYPEGEGAGTYATLSNFISLSQVREIAQSGGDFNDFTWAYVEDRMLRQRSRPTDANPIKLTFTFDYDPALPQEAALNKITNSQMLTAMRETLPDGTILIYTGYIAYNKSPTRTRNQNMTTSAVMTVNSDIIRYTPAA